MTYDPAAIRAQIKTLLATSTKIANVYDFLNPNLDGYPAIIFDVSEDNGEMLDDSNDLVALTFTIYIIADIKVAGMEAGKTLLDNAVKDINTSLMKKTNDSLSGTVDWVMPTLGSRKQANSPEGNFIYQEMKLKCMVASSIL